MFIPTVTLEKEKLIDDIRMLGDKIETGGFRGKPYILMIKEQIRIMMKLQDLMLRYTV